MKEIRIYIIGKYDYHFRVSIWSYYLNYKTAVIKTNGEKYEDGSVNRALLHGLYEALQRITEPCHIIIYTKVSLGFDNPRKSIDKNTMLNIVQTIIKAGHIVEYIVANELSQVNIWEQLYGTPFN